MAVKNVPVNRLKAAWQATDNDKLRQRWPRQRAVGSDALVHQLYGLTEEEIKIVEGRA
jgi:hypothetical protein